MTDAAAAVGMDRLPWLEDEPASRAVPRVHEPKPAKPRRAQGNPRELAGWAVAAGLLVAGASYWLGTQSVDQAGSDYDVAAPEATVRLPEARTPPPTPQLPMTEVPQVRPAPAPHVKFDRPARNERPATARRKLTPMEMKDSDLSRTISEQEAATAKLSPKSEPAAAAPVRPAPAPVAPLASRQQLRYWPARQTRGASGRLVQIGAFGSRQQAKLGWRRMKRAYPAVGRLQAVVVETRNSRGRRFYRFQIGTTSQAHSEVLCQRMERIRFSCAVVGLPWKAKVER